MEIVPLSRLTVAMVDMLTVVIVGASRTRVIERGGRSWVYTPRGYAAKAAQRHDQHGKVPAGKTVVRG